MSKIFIPGQGFRDQTPEEATELASAQTAAQDDRFSAQIAKSAVLEQLSRVALDIAGNVPPREADSWFAKEASARAHDAGAATASDTAMLQSEIDYTGETVAELVARIIAKADAFRIVAARLAGIRRKAEAAIDAAANVTERRAAVAAAEADIATLASDMGV